VPGKGADGGDLYIVVEAKGGSSPLGIAVAILFRTLISKHFPLHLANNQTLVDSGECDF
jgi:hypothetical protein